MPTINFDSGDDYINGIEATVTHSLGGGIGATFEADAEIGGQSATMTLRSNDLYIIKFDGNDIRDDAYTASKLNRDLTYHSVRQAAFDAVGLVAAGDGKVNFDGANKDIFLISVAESLRFPPITYLIAYLLNGGEGTINTKHLKFINQWEQISRKLIAAGRSDLRACSLLRNAGAARVSGGDCRLSVYEWMRRRFALGMATKNEVVSQLKMVDVYSCNLDIALAEH